ncbi:hypothetical protein F5Y19DRAFT_17459 [Xylariaceae sp. FL1651]|nr:hypothetical protein F5Y19DRAFT_17459 [Xylariaceae sp. FL1651]
MKTRSGSRSSGWVPIPQPNNYHQHRPFEAESSDEDDGGIPATKLPSMSPSKRPLSSSSRHIANRAKRPLSNIDQGGIVLYPGSKKHKVGYNMAIPREQLPYSTPDSFRTPVATAQTPSRDRSLSLCPEDDVPAGLFNKVNAALRDLEDRQTSESIKLQLEQLDSLAPQLLSGDKSDEQSDVANLAHDHDSGLPQVAVAVHGMSNASALEPNTSNDMYFETEDVHATHDETAVGEDLHGADAPSLWNIHAESILNKQNRIEVKAPMVAGLGHTYDVWDIQSSPGQQGRMEEHHAARFYSTQQPQTRKRGRPPKLSRANGMRDSSSNGMLGTGKRKVGRPRKNYPRLRGESDQDYTIRIARIQKKPIPNFVDPVSRTTSQSSPAEILDLCAAQINLGSAEHDNTVEFRPGSQAGSSSVLIRGSCRACSDMGDSHLITEPEVQVKCEPDEDVAPTANLARPDATAGHSNEHTTGTRGVGDKIERQPIAEHGYADNNGNALGEEVDYEDENDSEDGEDDGIQSDFIDVLGTDSESDKDGDLLVKDSFTRDLEDFKARQISRAEDDDEAFEGPSDNDVIAIRLDHQHLRQVCKLLSDASWTGRKGEWQWQPFSCDYAETELAQALLPVLRKLERLYQAAPKAPHLKEQNRFLAEHADMLRYYFHKIGRVVDHIRTQRLEKPERNRAAQNISPRRRRKMTRDLVQYIIPMLIHVFVSAWGLGGDTWSKTSFTSTAVELLRRTLGWILMLHRPLLGELRRYSLESKPESLYQQQVWRRRNMKSEEIEPLLDGLSQVIAEAPDRLAKREAHINQEVRRRQWQLKQEEELKAQLKQDEEAKLASVEERKKRFLLSIRGIQYPPESSTSSRPSPSLALAPSQWSLEERMFLFRKIQDSFPELPNMSHLRWELNKPVTETAAMTEQLLKEMLKAANPDQSKKERIAEVHRIMQRSDERETSRIVVEA